MTFPALDFDPFAESVLADPFPHHAGFPDWRDKASGLVLGLLARGRDYALLDNETLGTAYQLLGGSALAKDYGQDGVKLAGCRFASSPGICPLSAGKPGRRGIARA